METYAVTGLLRDMDPWNTLYSDWAPVDWRCGCPSHAGRVWPITGNKLRSQSHLHIRHKFANRELRLASCEFSSLLQLFPSAIRDSGIRGSFSENGAAATRVLHHQDDSHSISDTSTEAEREILEESQAVSTVNTVQPLVPTSRAEVQFLLASLAETFPGIEMIACGRNVETCLRLGATPSQILQFFTFSPRLILEDVSSRISDSVSILEVYGMSRYSLWAIYSRPRVKCRPANLPFLREKEKLFSILEVLRNDLYVRDVTKVLEKDATLLHRLPESLRAKGQLLREVGVDLRGHILEKFPGVLGTKTSLISSSAAMLQSLLGEAYPDIINTYPLLLSVTAESLQCRENALKVLFGEDAALQLILKCPSLLIAQESTIQTTFKNLSSVFGKKKCPDILMKYPYLLASNWKNTLGPKFDYLLSTANRGVDDIVGYPVSLSFSLNGRIKPRFEALRAVGKGLDCSLRSILYPSNSVFESKFEVVLNIPSTRKL